MLADLASDSYDTESISSRTPELGLDSGNDGSFDTTGLIGALLELVELKFVIERIISAMRCMKLSWIVGRAWPISI